MADWVVYTGNLSAAIVDLRNIDPTCVADDDDRIVASITPLVRSGGKAITLVRSPTTESDIGLNAVVALGNLEILGCFYLGEFLEDSPTALATFESMRPKAVTKTGIDGEDVTVTPPVQWASFA